VGPQHANVNAVVTPTSVHLHLVLQEVEEAVILGWHGSGSNALEVKLLECGSRFWFPLEHVMFWLGFDGYPKPPDAQVQRQSSSSDDGLTGGLPLDEGVALLGHAKHAGNPSTYMHGCCDSTTTAVKCWQYTMPLNTICVPAGNSRPMKRQRTMLVKKERRTYRTLTSKFQQV
jgi:hypothetical protein